MKTTKLKLIRVMEGIYRNENGGIYVFRRSWENKDLPWVVCCKDISSCHHKKKFRTLSEVRSYLNGQ